MADTVEALRVVGAMAPIIRDFMSTAERSNATGEEKRQAVLDLTEAVYRGAQRTGTLDGVKELRGLDWALLAPVIAVLVDGLVALLNRLRIWINGSQKK